MNERKFNSKPLIIILAILAAAAAAVFIVLYFNNRNHKLRTSVEGEEGLYGTWVSDYSKCVVTVERDGTVTEINGIDVAVVRCDITEDPEEDIEMIPVEGDFLFADYYIYEPDINRLTSYIYLDTQQLVHEEYITYYKEE